MQKKSERSKGRIFPGSKTIWIETSAKGPNLGQLEKLSLIARKLEIIPSVELSGLHCYIIR